MRLFLAINPPPDVRHEIWQTAAPLRASGPGVSWTAEEKIHLTMKFLGEQPESAVASLAATLASIGRGHSAPIARIRSCGAFPNFRRPRVVWVGVDPDPRLELLHHDVEIECARLGYELEGRAFRPHLTLGRIREPLDAGAVAALREARKTIRFSHEFPVHSIELMQSVPGPSGSTYSVLSSAPLRSN